MTQVPKITFRIATSKDWKLLQKLNREVFEDNAIYDDDIDLSFPLSDLGEQKYRQTLQDPENICLFACHDDEVVGYLCAIPLSFSFRKSRYLEISHMGVSPAWRSMGIGSKLIKECEKEAKMRGFQRLFVSSYWKNTAAIRFYKLSNFVEESVNLEKKL